MTGDHPGLWSALRSRELPAVAEISLQQAAVAPIVVASRFPIAKLGMDRPSVGSEPQVEIVAGPIVLLHLREHVPGAGIALLRCLAAAVRGSERCPLAVQKVPGVGMAVRAQLFHRGRAGFNQRGRRDLEGWCQTAG